MGDRALHGPDSWSVLDSHAAMSDWEPWHLSMLGVFAGQHGVEGGPVVPVVVPKSVRADERELREVVVVDGDDDRSSESKGDRMATRISHERHQLTRMWYLAMLIRISLSSKRSHARCPTRAGEPCHLGTL